MDHHSTWTRRIGVLSAVPLALALTSAAAAQTPEASMEPMGSLPPWAVTISGIEQGTTITDNEVTLGVDPVGFAFDCAHAGKPNVDGIGHYHVILDGALIDMKCTPTTTISMQNVAPGTHTVIAVPALNDHEEIQAGAAMLSFEYAPTNPLPDIAAAAITATPTISILSPAAGSEVSGDFTVTVQATDFTFSNALFGKPNLDGYGHWHLNVDTTEGPMMGMMTMLGMSGTDTFQASTVGIEPGPHTFFAIVVDNQHAPLMEVGIAQVELIVK